MIVPEKHLYCYLDRKPISKSKVYQLMCKWKLSKKVANILTYKDY